MLGVAISERTLCAKGGFMGMGVLGLFIGAIVLSVGYKLFLAWLGDGAMAKQVVAET